MNNTARLIIIIALIACISSYLWVSSNKDDREWIFGGFAYAFLVCLVLSFFRYVL